MEKESVRTDDYLIASGMKNDDDAICAGCGRTAGELAEYDNDNLVQDDGTYSDHKFVCTDCYIKLIPLKLDIGSPEEIQSRAKERRMERGGKNERENKSE